MNDVEVKSRSLDTNLEVFIEVTFVLQATSMYTYKGYHWLNEKIVAKNLFN